LPHQREALTTLGQLADTMTREGLQSPSIIVVGDVVQGARAWQVESVVHRRVA
jgi:uroporphyrin-III C-methyltransferase